MQEMAEPHLAQNVVVLVECGRIDAERDAAAAPHRFGDRRDAAAQVQIRARVCRDDRARGGYGVKLVGPSVDAMRERQARREKPERHQARHDALGIFAVGEGALISGLQQMHVNAPPGPPRGLRDCREKRVGAPLRTVGSELHAKGGALDCRGDRLDAGDLLFGAGHGGKELRLDHAARFVGQPRQDAVARRRRPEGCDRA